jgi:5-methylcytosine-specific restriction endonuclease McrA
LSDSRNYWRKALEKFVEFVNKEETPIIKDESEESRIDNLQPEFIKKHKTKRNISWRLRFIVMRRDNFKCRGCGRSPARDPKIVLHVDHIIPWTKGGETVLDNLQTLCSICNLGKGDLQA